MRVAKCAACWPLEISEREAGESFAIVGRAHSIVRRCEHTGSRIGFRTSVGIIGMWEVGVVVVRILTKQRNRCKMSTTAAPAPRVGILDGGGKSGRCTTAVVIRCGIIIVVHIVGMVLFIIIAICRKGHGRSI